MSPFEVLGIPANASEEQIKNTYRSLAKKFHPDSSSEYADAVAFSEITKAYKEALKSINADIVGIDLSDLFTISIKESILGINRSYLITKCVPCECESLGTKCLKCHGNRYVKYGINLKVKCDRCNGSGFENPKNCQRCRGSGFKLITESIKLSTKVPINEGECRTYNYSQGKLTIKFHIEKSESDIYDRIGDDLIYSIGISPLDQLLGSIIYIPKVNLEKIKLEIKENCNIPSYYKIPNEGVPGTKGSLIIKIFLDPRLLDTKLIPIIRKAVSGVS